MGPFSFRAHSSSFPLFPPFLITIPVGCSRYLSLLALGAAYSGGLPCSRLVEAKDSIVSEVKLEIRKGRPSRPVGLWNRTDQTSSLHGTLLFCSSPLVDLWFPLFPCLLVVWFSSLLARSLASWLNYALNRRAGVR